MEYKLILAGIGGQGVIFATKLLSYAALARGEHVIASENHGMSQRGGSVLAHIKIGGSESPLIRHATADTLIAFDQVEALRNLTFVRAHGSVVVNSPTGLDPNVLGRLSELGIGVLAIDAEACRRELGTASATNLVVLGFAAAQSVIGVSVDDLKKAVCTLGPAKAVELNLKALDAGVARAG